VTELAGTGFENNGATLWRTSTVTNVTEGDSINIKFMIWDSGDGALDSTVLLDDFQWVQSYL
jgi:hypothetical protein